MRSAIPLAGSSLMPQDAECQLLPRAAAARTGFPHEGRSVSQCDFLRDLREAVRAESGEQLRMPQLPPGLIVELPAPTGFRKVERNQREHIAVSGARDERPQFLALHRLLR